MQKDLNYIAKLEKVISEKYGELAAINPRSLWNEEKEKQFVETLKETVKKDQQSEQTKEKIEHEGILINKKLLKQSGNKNCEGCKKYSLDKKDDVYLLKFSSCFDCYIKYIEDRENRWLSGWRPQTEK
jgi:hypothetical protein